MKPRRFWWKENETKAFWEYLPLLIAEAGEGNLGGHKEPFDPGKCLIAMRTTGSYEASCNIDWLWSWPAGEAERRIMGDVPTLPQLMSGVAAWFDFSEETLASPQGLPWSRLSEMTQAMPHGVAITEHKDGVKLGTHYLPPEQIEEVMAEK